MTAPGSMPCHQQHSSQIHARLHQVNPSHTCFKHVIKRVGMGSSHGGVGTAGLGTTPALTTYWQGIVAKNASPHNRPQCRVAGHCVPWWWACMASTQRAVQCEAFMTATCCVCWELDGWLSCKLIFWTHSSSPHCAARHHCLSFLSGQAGKQSKCCCWA